MRYLIPTLMQYSGLIYSIASLVCCNLTAFKPEDEADSSLLVKTRVIRALNYNHSRPDDAITIANLGTVGCVTCSVDVRTLCTLDAPVNVSCRLGLRGRKRGTVQSLFPSRLRRQQALEVVEPGGKMEGASFLISILRCCVIDESFLDVPEVFGSAGEEAVTKVGSR
jgi:hypothetical protein